MNIWKDFIEFETTVGGGDTYSQLVKYITASCITNLSHVVKIKVPVCTVLMIKKWTSDGRQCGGPVSGKSS